MPSDNEVKAELDFGEVPKELLEWAKTEINEDPDTRCQLISEFRDMIYGNIFSLNYFLLNKFKSMTEKL